MDYDRDWDERYEPGYDPGPGWFDWAEENWPEVAESLPEAYLDTEAKRDKAREVFFVIVPTRAWKLEHDVYAEALMELLDGYGDPCQFDIHAWAYRNANSAVDDRHVRRAESGWSE